MRRPILAVVGNAGVLAAPVAALAADAGRCAIERGFRIATGGLGGVMAAASQGAHSASTWKDGDVIGVLPSYDRSTANPLVDIAIPTGLQLARNAVLVAMADAILAVGGGAGTLSEIAFAWQLGKPTVALIGGGGWSAELAGRALDERFATRVHAAETAPEAVELAWRLVLDGMVEPGEIGSGWRKP